jgi:hypothetical protein
VCDADGGIPKRGAELCFAFGESALCRDLLSNQLDEQQLDLTVSGTPRLQRAPQTVGAAILVLTKSSCAASSSRHRQLVEPQTIDGPRYVRTQSRIDIVFVVAVIAFKRPRARARTQRYSFSCRPHFTWYGVSNLCLAYGRSNTSAFV